MGLIIKFLGNYGSWENIAPGKFLIGAIFSQAIFYRTRNLLGKFSQEVSPRSSAIARDSALVLAPKHEE
jgi:hypothetical protein